MGVCQLCGCNASPAIDFDLWRQFTWEHILGESQGGYLKDIRLAVQQRFPDLTSEQSRALTKRIEVANTVTACSFCNSATSREKAPVTMGELIAQAQGSPDEVVAQEAVALQGILAEKRTRLQWKLAAVKKAFEEQIAPTLNAARAAGSHPPSDG